MNLMKMVLLRREQEIVQNIQNNYMSEISLV